MVSRLAILGMAWKNSAASSTVMSSTSQIFLPLYLTSKVSRLYRLPLQTSQGTYTSGRKFISILMRPSPEQASQRPPRTLKENRPELYPRALASGVWANSSRMSLNRPV